MNATLDDRRTRAILGAILVLLIGALGAVGIRAALGDFADEYSITATTVRTGFGLDAASAVKIRGISVGTVNGVRLLEDGTVELDLAINDGISIPETAAASIEPVSVFGPKFVDIRPGADETTGPFLTDGSTLGAIVEPSELIETLDAVSELLEVVDPEQIATLISELSRGVDGLGEDLGQTIDASVDLTARLVRIRPAFEALVRDAGLVAETLADRADDLAALGRDTAPFLDLLATTEDPLAEVLLATSELTLRTSDLVSSASDDLTGVLLGLEGGVGVLAEQLAFIPDFVDGLDVVTDLLGAGLFAWERGPGLFGLLGHGFLDFEPCTLSYIPSQCPLPPGYTG